MTFENYTCSIFIHTFTVNPIAIASVLIIITTTSTTVIGITINCSNTVLCIVIVVSNVIVVPVNFSNYSVISFVGSKYFRLYSNREIGNEWINGWIGVDENVYDFLFRFSST